ncbi:MAG: DUF1275 domain-containing protein [Bacteroidetes bacterium]|nr:DUF1275 domain-containing protein [Bacteroidota bacterium]
MLHHLGKERNFKHDFYLAILLGLNAGFVNAAGFLAFGVLTTNITGHAALLAIDVASGTVAGVAKISIWLLSFAFGAFISGLWIQTVGNRKPPFRPVPLLILILILLSVAICGSNKNLSSLLITGLLFGMGIQNALVSVVSGFVVRTTHLTGMVTDLGIDLSSMFNERDWKEKRQRIFLRLTIIASFLGGGILGGLLFYHFSFIAFYIPALVLATTLLMDYISSIRDTKNEI